MSIELPKGEWRYVEIVGKVKDAEKVAREKFGAHDPNAHAVELAARGPHGGALWAVWIGELVDAGRLPPLHHKPKSAKHYAAI